MLTSASQMASMWTIYIIQRSKNSYHSTKSCSASTAATMATKQLTASDTHAVVKVAKATIQGNVKALLFIAFNARALMKLGTLSVRLGLQRKTG